MSTILVVDDEPGVLNLCRTILRRGGHETLTASSGTEALRLFQDKANGIDSVLVDVMMPGMNGLELANQIRSASPSITILLMSGYSAREILPLISSHSYRVIWKPFKAASLLQLIENAGPSNAVNAASA
jgi:two-component system cell cycle sensor histidine kinase/response regulator CckA